MGPRLPATGDGTCSVRTPSSRISTRSPSKPRMIGRLAPGPKPRTAMPGWFRTTSPRPVKGGEDPFAAPQRSTVPTLRKIAGKVADSNRARLSPGERKARAATLERHAADLFDLGVVELLRFLVASGYEDHQQGNSAMGAMGLRS